MLNVANDFLSIFASTSHCSNGNAPEANIARIMSPLGLPHLFAWQTDEPE